MADTLAKYSVPLFQDKPDIKLLTKPGETTRDNVVQTLKDMQATVAAGDVFVFYAASHGVIADGEYFLITSDVESAAPDVLKKEALSQADLIGFIANIPAVKKLMFIDTCYAEALGSALDIAVRTGGMSVATAATQMARSIGVTVVAAANTNEEAIDDYKGHGLFTYVLADGLAGQADLFKQGVVTNDGIAAYVRNTIPSLARNLYRHQQIPVAEPDGGEPYPVTKVQ